MFKPITKKSLRSSPTCTEAHDRLKILTMNIEMLCKFSPTFTAHRITSCPKPDMNNPLFNQLSIPYHQPLPPVSFPTYSFYPVYQPPFYTPPILPLLPSGCALERPPAMMHPLYPHPTSNYLVFHISHPYNFNNPVPSSSYAIRTTELNTLVQTEFAAVVNDKDDRITWEQCYTAVR